MPAGATFCPYDGTMLQAVEVRIAEKDFAQPGPQGTVRIKSSSSTALLHPGDIVAGRYRIQAKVAEGVDTGTLPMPRRCPCARQALPGRLAAFPTTSRRMVRPAAPYAQATSLKPALDARAWPSAQQLARSYFRPTSTSRSALDARALRGSGRPKAGWSCLGTQPPAMRSFAVFISSRDPRATACFPPRVRVRPRFETRRFRGRRAPARRWPRSALCG
jgi:hypothetical protein